MTKTLTKIQEVYFDLCDILDNNDYSKVKIKGLEEFDNLREFLIEQKNKLAEIEAAIDLERG
jgi:hypothetical protein